MNHSDPPAPAPQAALPSRSRRHATIRVVLVDDHHLLLEALRSALAGQPDIEIVGTAASIHELADLPVRSPDVVLMDYRLPDGTGADGCRLAKARWPESHVIILTAAAEAGMGMASLTAGADGVLLKSIRVGRLVDALHEASRGAPVLSPAMIGDVARELSGRLGTPSAARPASPDPLTPRELVVLQALAKGRSTRAIALELGLSQGTIRVHVEAIRRKFHVTSRLEAVSHAISLGIVEVPAA